MYFDDKLSLFRFDRFERLLQSLCQDSCESHAGKNS